MQPIIQLVIQAARPNKTNNKLQSNEIDSENNHLIRLAK